MPNAILLYPKCGVTNRTYHKIKTKFNNGE